MSDDRFNEYCEELLSRYTRKNTRKVTQRLENLCGFLRQKGDVSEVPDRGWGRRRGWPP